MVISKNWTSDHMLKARWAVRKKPGPGHRVYVDMGDRDKDGDSSWFRISFYGDTPDSDHAMKVATHIVDAHNADLEEA